MASKLVLGGAGGAAAYHYGTKKLDGFDLPTAVRDFAIFSSGKPSAPEPPRNTEDYDRLVRLVETLSKDVHRKNNSSTIIVTSNGQRVMPILWISAATGGVYVYLRYVKGWKLADMLYVTRSSLKKSISSVNEGLETITKNLSGVKNYITEQVSSLTKKQNETLEKQEALKGQLEGVGLEVEQIGQDISSVHGAVQDLENNMKLIASNQSYTNDGIGLLVRVVGALLKGQRSPVTEELEHFSKRSGSGALPAIGTRAPVPGLEALLELNSDFTEWKEVGQAPRLTSSQRAASVPEPQPETSSRRLKTGNSTRNPNSRYPPKSEGSSWSVFQ